MLATVLTIFFTSYNPVIGQTDSSPCIGAAGVDLCTMVQETNERPLALSQELVGRAEWKPFHYGDEVILRSDNPACYGRFIIMDTMNERFQGRGDIFYLDRSSNTSCEATVIKLEN